jgi:hypothetical protein
MRLAQCMVLFALAGTLPAAGPPPSPYAAVEVDPFVADLAVRFPADEQNSLLQEIAREISVEFPTVSILHLGEAGPSGHAVLRISGTITEFKPGNRPKRSSIGFGAGLTIVRAQVRLADAYAGQVFLISEVRGTRTGLAQKIVKLCNSARLIESH